MTVDPMAALGQQQTISLMLPQRLVPRAKQLFADSGC